MYVCVCVCVCVCVRTYVCMYVRMYVCMYVRTYVCTYADVLIKLKIALIPVRAPVAENRKGQELRDVSSEL